MIKNDWISSVDDLQNRKLPNCRSNWGVRIALDIQVYRDVPEGMHPAVGGEGVEILFRVLNRYSGASELTGIP